MSRDPQPQGMLKSHLFLGARRSATFLSRLKVDSRTQKDDDRGYSNTVQLNVWYRGRGGRWVFTLVVPDPATQPCFLGGDLAGLWLALYAFQLNRREGVINLN